MTAPGGARTARSYVAPEYGSASAPPVTTRPEYVDKDWLFERRFSQFWAAQAEGDLHEIHRRIVDATTQVERARNGELETLAQTKRGQDGKELVRELATRHSFPWVDIARMLSVSVPAVRKWRMSGGVSSENVSKLARLDAFAELLTLKGIRASSWMSAPMMPGYTVAPKHLYAEDTAGTLLDMAGGGQDPIAVLDALAPDWRSDYDARGYSVAKFDDGTFGVVSSGE